ncbi:rhodanese-like domain-containing protein [bacterium]|nr:rhodanese-like domain-containing protein [bacterium]
MKQTVIRMVILVVIAAAVASADGMMRGFSMDDMATTSNTLPPTRPRATPNEATPSTPATNEDPDDGMGMTSVQLRDAMQAGDVIVIDARPVELYTEGHLPGAYSIPYQAFSGGSTPEIVNILDPMQTYVVYCEGGDCHSSHMVASMLKQYGFESVAVFERGYPAWVDAGFEVEEGEPYL